MAKDPSTRSPQVPDRPAASARGGSEIQAWIASLESQNQSLGKRNRYLGILLLLGLLLLLIILWVLYSELVRSYAVLDDVQIGRNPAAQGRIQISFRVVKPGKVYLHRRSGDIEAEVIDYFRAAGPQQRNWSWVYEPGQDIDVSILYRGALWRTTQTKSFPTAKQADIVILMDTTGSMSRSIATLKDKCVLFSQALKEKQLDHRFALLGFGDAGEQEWLDTREFTNDVEQFRQYVSDVKRFDGGDLPESALDAIAAALTLPFDEKSTRRFYLVTDAQYHELADGSGGVTELVEKMNGMGVLLSVFTRKEYFPDYEPLVSGSENVQTIEDFGQVLSEGRILED